MFEVSKIVFTFAPETFEFFGCFFLLLALSAHILKSTKFYDKWGIKVSAYAKHGPNLSICQVSLNLNMGCFRFVLFPFHT
jgi:hypothetical protein